MNSLGKIHCLSPTSVSQLVVIQFSMLILILIACGQPSSEVDTFDSILVAESPSPAAEIEVSPSPTPTQTSVPSPTSIPEPTPTFQPAQVILPTPVLQLGTPTPLSGDPTTRSMAAVELRVNVIRGLSSEEKVEREFLTRYEMRNLIIDLLEEDKEKIEADEQLYKSLWILPPAANLYDIIFNLYSEGILGLYRSEEQKLYIVVDSKDQFGPEIERTYVHEFVHSLQQQHFDLRATFDAIEDNSDASLAFRALVEGDARLSEIAYTFQHMTQEEQVESQGSPTEALGKAFRASPYILQREYVFPYREGLDFAMALFQQAGWPGIDQAYGYIPQSTEQILHPEKYIARDQPVTLILPDFVAKLGDGWDLVTRNTMGELFIQSYLELGGSPEVAHQAAAGWGGDSYVLLTGPDGQVVLIMYIAWDSTEDAVEFYEAFSNLSEGITGIKWGLQDGPVIAHKLVLEGAGSIFTRIDGDRTLTIFTPSDRVLDILLGEFTVDN